MDILLSVIVFLLGCIVGLLVAIYMRRSRDTDRVIETLDRIAEERRTHTDATATVFLKEGRVLAQAILKEMQKAAKERRELIEIARDWDHPPESGEGPLSGPESDARPITTPGASTLPPDAPTPQSGYSLPELLRSTKESPK